MYIIPNTINIMWFGSFLRDSHQERIIQFKRINPNYSVNLWIYPNLIDSVVYDKFTSFCSQHNITLLDAGALLHPLMDERILSWLLSLIAYKNPNYGAITDIYRLYVLKAVGGWYFDTDVTPLLPLPINLSLTYGFAVNAKDDGDIINSVVPSVIVSSSSSPFIDCAIKIVNEFTHDHPSLLNPLINSTDALERMLSTHLTTGIIVRSACSKLYVNSNPLFHSMNDRDNEIDDYETYKKISISRLGLDTYFNVQGEMSWFVGENGCLHPELENVASLNNFMRSAYHALPPFCSDICLLNLQALDNIEAITLTTPELEPITPSPVAKSLGKHGVFQKPTSIASSDELMSANDTERSPQSKKVF